VALRSRERAKAKRKQSEGREGREINSWDGAGGGVVVVVVSTTCTNSYAAADVEYFSR
jgi:hypothetical protein